MSQPSLVSISEASHILGVSEAALRQWTDEGKIRAFITPGGHRRYSRVELKKFISSRHKIYSIKDLVAELGDTTQSHRDIAKTYLNSTPWYNKLSRESQERLVAPGKQLLSLIVRYIAEPSKRDEIIQHARDVGNDFGETLAQLGLPLTESVEAFIIHRNPMMDTATHLAKKREALDGRVVEAIPLVTHVMDEALVSLVSAHQHYQDRSQNKPSRGTKQ